MRSPWMIVPETKPSRFCSALSAWKQLAVCAAATRFRSRRPAARLFSEALEIGFVGIGEKEFEIAADAYAQFGNGRAAANLNLGDCFAYACARANGAALPFKGDDFTKTDIARASGCMV